jgi:hypothetical protein
VKLALVIVVLALPLAAQTPKPPEAPVISDTIKAQFFKAQSGMIQADQKAQQMRDAFTQIVSALTATCGANFQPQINPQGDPVCVAKPAGVMGSQGQVPTPAKETKPNGK